MRIHKSRDVKTPTRGTELSAGLDFYVPDDADVINLLPKSDVNIPSGIHVDLVPGLVLILFNKSGRATKDKLIVGAQVIDADYQGEIHLHVFNLGNRVVTILPGEKLTQGIVLACFAGDLEEVESLEKLYEKTTERGAKGFGSTGL